MRGIFATVALTVSKFREEMKLLFEFPADLLKKSPITDIRPLV